MNFLADYASDDDETNEEQRPAVVITKPPPSNTVSKPVSSSSSSSSSSSGQNKRDDEGKPKKKQAIIFSALPMEIQNALTQGSSTLDSDSDDDNAGIKGGPKIPSKTTSNGSARNPLGGTGLMSLLPAPKNAASLPKPVVAKSTTTTANSSGTMNAARPLIVAKTTTETVRVAATKQQSAVKTDDDDDDDDDNDDVILPKGRGMDLISQIRNSSAQQALPSMFSMSTTSTSQNNNTKESSAGWLDDEEPEILQLKPQVSSFHMASTDSNGMYGSSSSSSSGDGSMPSIPIAYPQQQDLVSSYPQYQFPQPLPDQPYNDDYGNGTSGYYDADPTSMDNDGTGADQGRGGRKKREREIEQQLLSGNLDAASGHMGVREVRQAHEWNPHEYTIQQQREAEVGRSFNMKVAPGESFSAKLTAPNKMASRKHQITSLVAQAAKTELLMLDSKGKHNKTRAETASKYGW